MYYFKTGIFITKVDLLSFCHEHNESKNTQAKFTCMYVRENKRFSPHFSTFSKLKIAGHLGYYHT